MDRWVGIDVGSTTVKIVVVDPIKGKLLFSRYLRHNADQQGMVFSLLIEAHRAFPEDSFHVAVCGSGGQTIAEHLKAFFIQEVVANAIAVKRYYPETRVAIELGGQDAKVIFFRLEKETGKLLTSDMRMNGSCAGGTGAFIDQIAELLNIRTEDFEDYARRGKHIYDISGRCGVFAKTDIQPLLNQGISKEDIALSSFHAIAKQTIGGLAQGMRINPKIIFEGGPLTFNPTLIRAFKERLNLKDEDILVPENPELIIAHGAALSIGSMFKDYPSEYHGGEFLEALMNQEKTVSCNQQKTNLLFFNNDREREKFERRNPLVIFEPPEFESGSLIDCYIGIDAGSTTTKFVVIDNSGELINKFYSSNFGNPLGVIKQGLQEMKEIYREQGVHIRVLGLGTTGYGEHLFARALKADYHTVETVAHAEAAKRYAPDVDYILDIGGQDMKAVKIEKGIITSITLNEACSAGCGSFIETYAASLGIPMEQIDQLAFQSSQPSKLGSRCTVFMNSSIITEQKNGRTTEDILAGLCRSIIENVFTKVLRLSNTENLGKTILVQGGTFKNDAVLRALEQYLDKEVLRPPFPGVMGALGIALLTKQSVEMRKKTNPSYTSSFFGLENIDSFDFKKQSGLICPFCANNCKRTLITFSDGSTYVTGNRCGQGEIFGNPKDPGVRQELLDHTAKTKEVFDQVKSYNIQLTKDFIHKKTKLEKDVGSLKNSNVERNSDRTLPSSSIGIPRVLEFWESLPYWKAVFESLGVTLVISPKSSYRLFESGLPGVPSDTSCFPAKIVHGHVRYLIEQGVDRIFMPMVLRLPKKNRHALGGEMCPLIQGYPMVIESSEEPHTEHGIPFDRPAFHWFTPKLRRKQTREYLRSRFPNFSRAIISHAIKNGEEALQQFEATMQEEAQTLLNNMERSENFGVLLAGRPYHNDELVNHHLSKHFTRLGIPVLTLSSLPMTHSEDILYSRMETYNPFHTRMLEAAIFVARHPSLELVQLVSFGCGHDAIISDEMSRILKTLSNKELLILKLDEGEAAGPLNIRIRSFIETVRQKRRGTGNSYPAHLGDPYPVKFLRKDKKSKIILIPNLSPAFSYISAKIMEYLGYRTLPLPLADERAIALGKKYVHNDICFPAQINIGEILSLIKGGAYSPNILAVGLAKNCIACRAGQYAGLARKALDDAGYENIPIITTGKDEKKMHPGFVLDARFHLKMLWGLTIMDGIEYMRRSLRPYELKEGDTEKTFSWALQNITSGLCIGYETALKAFKKAVYDFNQIKVDRSIRKPRVGLIGEILMNYHPSSNGFIETYLEKNGMEVILPGMVDFFRKKTISEISMARRKLHAHPFMLGLKAEVFDKAFNFVHEKVGEILQGFRFAEYHHGVHELISNVSGLIDSSYHIGEGWLIPAEIMQLASYGVNSFVIVQPFGCMPNHITGRGMIKAIKKYVPHIQILALDYDPDTSIANVENRLQMLIMTARELEKELRMKKTFTVQEDIF